MTLGARYAVDATCLLLNELKYPPTRLMCLSEVRN